MSGIFRDIVIGLAYLGAAASLVGIGWFQGTSYVINRIKYYGDVYYGRRFEAQRVLDFLLR